MKSLFPGIVAFALGAAYGYLLVWVMTELVVGCCELVMWCFPNRSLYLTIPLGLAGSGLLFASSKWLRRWLARRKITFDSPKRAAHPR